MLLIDADLRRPRMHEEFDIPDTKGFTSILLGETNPAELLAMPRTREILEQVQAPADDSYGYGYYFEAGYYTGPPPGATYGDQPDEPPDDGSRRRVRIGRR